MMTDLVGILTLSPLMGSAQNTPMPPQQPTQIPTGMLCPAVLGLPYQLLMANGVDANTSIRTLRYYRFGVKMVKVTESITKPARGYSSDIKEYLYTRIPDGNAIDPKRAIYVRTTQTKIPDGKDPSVKLSVVVKYYELTSYGVINATGLKDQEMKYLCDGKK